MLNQFTLPPKSINILIDNMSTKQFPTIPDPKKREEYEYL